MSPSAYSVFVFGIYIAFVGAGFLLIPNSILPLLKLPKTTEPWIRVVGILIAVLAFYYIFAAQNELTSFFLATVIGRFAIFISFIVLVATKKAPTALIMFGIIDGLGGLWTFLTL